MHLLLATVTGLARALPLPAAYWAADVATSAQLALPTPRRDAVEENLRILLRTESAPRTAVREAFRNYGRFLVEFLRGPDLPELDYEFEGLEHLAAAHARGKGTILCATHSGNWELAAARLAQRGYTVYAVAGVQLRAGWTEELRGRQAAAGIRILPPGITSWRRMLRALADGGTLALLVDGDIFDGGIEVDFGGGRVRFPAGPARLAARTGAAILPAISERDAAGRPRLRILPEIELRDDSPAELAAATQRLAERLEAWVRSDPGQWLIFRRFFATAPERAA